MGIIYTLVKMQITLKDGKSIDKLPQKTESKKKGVHQKTITLKKIEVKDDKEEILQLIERYGLTLILLLGSLYALYKFLFSFTRLFQQLMRIKGYAIY